MTTEYKVGDKVTVTNKVMGYYGKSGVVTSLEGYYKQWPIDVRLENGAKASYAADEIDLAAKFKVGDWVKVQGRGDKWDGTVGTVQKVTVGDHSGHGNCYTIFKNDSAAEPLGFYESKLVATEAPVTHKFKVGDWVEVTGWSTGWDGQVLQVDGLPPLGSKYYLLSDGAGFSDAHLKAAKAPKSAGLTLTNRAGAVVLNGKPADMVNGPIHYGGADNPYEVIKVAEAWGLEKNAYLFNALKYLGRAEHKGKKVEDLEKLVYYVKREIALEEAK